MEDVTMNIYDAKPLLYDMLNVKGFNLKILKKTRGWTDGKYARHEFYSVKPGYNEKDIDLVNSGLRELGEFCKKRILKLPSECNDAEIYGQYVAKQLKELREVISMPYLRENYTKMADKTFIKKMRQSLNANGKPYHFTDSDITSINTGIASMADTFERLKLTL